MKMLLLPISGLLLISTREQREAGWPISYSSRKGFAQRLRILARVHVEANIELESAIVQSICTVARDHG